MEITHDISISAPLDDTYPFPFSWIVCKKLKRIFLSLGWPWGFIFLDIFFSIFDVFVSAYYEFSSPLFNFLHCLFGCFWIFPTGFPDIHRLWTICSEHSHKNVFYKQEVKFASAWILKSILKIWALIYVYVILNLKKNYTSYYYCQLLSYLTCCFKECSEKTHKCSLPVVAFLRK